MGPGRDQTRDQTCDFWICSQTPYRLGYAARQQKIVNSTKSACMVNSFLASSYLCTLLITFANSLDPQQNIGPDLDPTVWHSVSVSERFFWKSCQDGSSWIEPVLSRDTEHLTFIWFHFLQIQLKYLLSAFHIRRQDINFHIKSSWSCQSTEIK